MKQIITILIVLWVSFIGFGKAETIDSLLQQGRIHFYKAVPEKESVALGEKIFLEIAARDSLLKGRAQTYLGALTMLRGKHASWPYTQFKLVMQGLKEMDAGLLEAGDDIEALFVHGTTCYYLPFFFSRSDEAEQDFKRLIKLLPEKHKNYDTELVQNVLNFLLENVQLSESEKNQLLELKE